MKHHGETFSLANGVAIPCLGFGTWQMKEYFPGYENIWI